MLPSFIHIDAVGKSMILNELSLQHSVVVGFGLPRESYNEYDLSHLIIFCTRQRSCGQFLSCSFVGIGATIRADKWRQKKRRPLQKRCDQTADHGSASLFQQFGI